jgi:hypothetical protein
MAELLHGSKLKSLEGLGAARGPVFIECVREANDIEHWEMRKETKHLRGAGHLALTF